MEVAWRVSLEVSGLHAAHALAEGRALVDPSLTAALAPAAHHLRQDLAAFPIPSFRLWRHLLPLAAEFPEPRELARVVLLKATGGGSPLQLDRLAGRLMELGGAFRQAVKPIAASTSPLAELRLRERPLRELFEGRGPGLLVGVAQLTEPALIAESATVLTVHPALGGAGEAHLDYNSVRIEALLANPRPELPEVLRLGWLLAQLQQDLPRISETIQRDRLPALAALAMLPPTLTAGEQVELTRADRQTALAAIEAWRIETPPSWSADRVGPLWAWWESYQSARPPWPVALAALAGLCVSG